MKRITEMFGIAKRASSEEVKMAEKDILSLLVSEKGPIQSYVVGEEVRFMGSSTSDFANGKEVVIYKPGDEITVIPYMPFDKYESLFATSQGADVPDIVQIIMHNAEYSNMGQSFFFIKSEIKNRKIKINESVKTQYS